MAYVDPQFSEYTYKIAYKLDESSEEIVLSAQTRIIPATTTIVSGGQVVTVPNPNYNYFMNTVTSRVEPVNGAILKIYRNILHSMDPDTGDKQELAPETLISTTTFDFLSYDYRKAIIINDSKIGTSESLSIIVQILNINLTEKLPCKYALDGLKFAVPVSQPQHVDLSYQKVGDVDWIPIGTNITVDPDGNIEDVQLANLPEDTEYILKVFHYESNDEKLFSFTSNLIPTLGPNPIVDKIEWNGRVVMFDAPGVKARMYPNKNYVDWMFGLDYSTKSFDNIVSSMWTSIVDDYNFVMKVSNDNSKEVYIGSGVNRTNYLSLPIDYVNPNLPDLGASQNMFYKTLFNTTAPADERRTLFCKFFIDTDHEGAVRLINFMGNNNTFIGFNVDSENVISFTVFGTSYTIPVGQEIVKGKWYTLMLVIKDTTIKYASITDYSNYSMATLPINAGVVIGKVEDRTVLHPASRADINVSLTYDGSTTDIEHMGIAIEYAIYQYESNSPDNNRIVRAHTPYQKVVAGAGNVINFIIPNESGYGVAIGYSVVFLYGGVTSNGNVTVTNVSVNGVNVLATSIVGSPVNVDPRVTDFMSATNTVVNFLKTDDVVPDPVGGILFEDIAIPAGVSANTRIHFGGGVNLNAHFAVAKIGFRKTTIIGADDWGNPYQYLDSSVFEMLGSGYKRMPYIRATNGTQVNIISTFNMTEMKDATVMFILDGLPVGETLLEIMSDDLVLNSKTYTIKTLRMTPSQLEYDIDFELDFDIAVTQLKERYYAKQKRWGGNMGGGTHGALIYFNRGDKCLILEQHGDLYVGDVPSVSPAGKEGYGFPTDLVEIPSTFPSQVTQRCARVGGLIQSVDYHAYGMFDCWFSVPKGMAGLAICLWYFHYQEIYNYDRTFKFWTETGWNGHKYADSVESGFGATWVVINNEIDMELGSENTPYRTPVNPNTDRSISWYVHGLSYRQMIGCTNSDPTLYGTWIIDWEASLPVIDSVLSNDPNNVNAYVWTDQLVWVKVNDKLDEVNYGANNRSCRFNNWVNERWNDGAGVYGAPSSSPLGKRELSVNNRTPLGDVNAKALEQAKRYIEKYYDDGRYHKWSIDWTKDYTRLLIDDQEIAILKTFVPFNPMTMLIGCWFPSGNIYDKGVILGEYGTWGGVHANWSTAQMKVKRIKYAPYTEAQVPTNQMRYDCETYAQDGLREII